MLLNTINRLIIGLIAVVVGVGFWIAAPKPVTVASENTHYTSTWEAVDNLIARRNWGPNDPNQNSEIKIGVATWKVTGHFGDSGPYFKEIWDSPATLPTFYADGTIGNASLDNWIAGQIMISPHNYNNIGPVTISKRNHLLERGLGGNGPDTITSGGTAACLPNWNDCIYATGSYGFTDYHDYHIPLTGKDVRNAVVIPTRWTVTGTVCEDQSPECQ